MMNKIRGSKLERFQKKKSDDFIGRDEPIAIFKRHLDATPGEDGFYDIFNIFGQGGVGKSYLIEKFQEFSREKGILTSYTDEGIHDALQFMNSITELLEKQNVSLKRFSERYKKFLQEKQKLDADPEAPKGVLSMLTNTIVKSGLTIAEDIPGAGGLVKMVDKEAWASKAGELAEYIKKGWSNEDEAQLLLEPLKVLTPLFLEDLWDISDKKNLILFIDTYEETSFFLDEWLRDLLNGEYGRTSDNLVLVISGRAEVNPNDWAPFNDFKCRISLEPFTEEEARRFLHKKNIQNPEVVNTILKLSLRLPIMLAMLSDEAPNSPEEITDFNQTAVDRFLKWINNSVQRQLALNAALPRQLNKDVIKRLLTDTDDLSLLFDWLIKRPFVQHRGGIWVYHPVVRELMLKYLLDSSPEEWKTLHSKLADYYYQCAKSLGIENKEIQFTNEKWQKLILEKCYHDLLINYNQNVPESIRSFVTTFRLNGYKKTLPWAEIIKDCGEINNDPDWGNRLIAGLDGLRLQNWKASLEIVSKINDSHLLVDHEDRSFLHLFEGTLHLDSCLKKAIECTQKSIDIKPDNDLAWLNLGIAYGQQGNTEKEIECYRKSIDIKPDKDSAWYNLGIAYGQQGNTEKEIECYRKSIDIKPDNDSVWLNLGIVYGQQGNTEKAIEYIQKSIDIKPDKDSAWCNLGIVYGQQGNTEKAIECYRKSIDIKPDNIFAWSGIGWEFLKIGKLEEAINALLTAWKYSKQTIEQVPMNLGHAFLLQKNKETAMKWYQTSLLLWNNHEAFFQGMKSDFSDLAMEKYEISQQDFDIILEALKQHNG